MQYRILTSSIAAYRLRNKCFHLYRAVYKPQQSVRTLSIQSRATKPHRFIFPSLLFASFITLVSSKSPSYNHQSLKEMSDSVNVELSADAAKAEANYRISTYNRQTLLNELRSMHEMNPSDIHVSWRLARAAYDVANLKATPAEEKKELIYYANDLIKETLETGDHVCEVHDWYGITLSSIGDYEGSKAAIANSYIIKEHWEKAIEINPNHAITYHLLGRWCIAIADLSWLERKAASVLFGTPPQSSYEEALGYLLKYEELSPTKWKKNKLDIAQAYIKLNDKVKGKGYLEELLALPTETEEDEEVNEKASALLKKL